MSKIHYLDNIDFTVSSSEILERLGYHPGRVPAGVRTMVDEIADRASAWVTPVAAYRPLANEEYAHSHYLCHIGELVVSVVTIGSELEQEVAKFKDRGDLSRALILDHYGCAAVASAADQVEQAIQEHVATLGLKCSHRFSPGLSGWNTEELKWILPAVQAEKLGVTLTEGCRMVPRQTCAFAVTIGSHPVDMQNPDICGYCGMVNCRFKDKPDRHSLGAMK